MSLIYRAVKTARSIRQVSDVFVSTDSPEIRSEAERAGAWVVRRPECFSGSEDRDVEWVARSLREVPSYPNRFVLLRCTSPFLKPSSVSSAIDWWEHSPFDSIRAVKQVSEHPCKMWEPTTYQGEYSQTAVEPPGAPLLGIRPVLPASASKRLYERPTQQLMDCYVQCGAFELSSWDLVAKGNLSGENTGGYVLGHPESLDVNTKADLFAAQGIAG